MYLFAFCLVSLTISICLIYAPSATAETSSVQILTSQNEFEIMQNKTTEITFIINDLNEPLEIAVFKKHVCYDVSEPIYIAGHLTPYARRGIYVRQNGREEYTIEFNNAQSDDSGTYIVSVLRRLSERFEHVTNRSINLLYNGEDLSDTCTFWADVWYIWLDNWICCCACPFYNSSRHYCFSSHKINANYWWGGG